MARIKSIKKQGKSVEVITATREYYFFHEPKQSSIMTSVFDIDVKDNDAAMKEGKTYDYSSFRREYNRRIGVKAVNKVFKLLNILTYKQWLGSMYGRKFT